MRGEIHVLSGMGNLGCHPVRSCHFTSTAREWANGAGQLSPPFIREAYHPS